MEKYQFSKEEQDILESLLQPYAIYQFVDQTVKTLAISDGFCHLFGYDDRQEAYCDMDHNMYKDTYPDDVARIADAAYRFATEEIPYDVIYRSRLRNGSGYRIIHATGKHVYTNTGVRLAHVWYTDEGVYSEGMLKNGTELKCSFNQAFDEASLIRKSQFNSLTGLANMTYFFERAEIGKIEILNNGGQAVLLFMDLSGMKFFNARHGFSEGDKLLQAFARLLSRTFHAENCCHVSGDHFLVYTCEEGLEDILRDFFCQCEHLYGDDSLPVRIGIYSTSMEDVPVSIACDRAKIACDAMRNTFKSCYKYYEQSMRDDAERRQYILGNIDRALAEKWITVYYQPIVRAVNGRVCDEEALARWNDPVRGFLSPAYFIPYLEDSGQIYKLDLYMLDRVLEKMNLQRKLGFNIVPHSINFSRSDFSACDLVEEVRKRVDASGIVRNMITIEVTESAVGTNFDFMKEQINRFQQLGFPVWMDDFGSGYSSLDVLSSIKFNLLKFDMVFMRKFDEGDSRKILLTELMRMATSLGVDTVCEGVETETQVHFLQEIGCSKLQGFYYEKPIPLEKILERYEKGIQIGYENPVESEYYEQMGRVNLYDMAIIANDNENSLDNIFNTLPMAIVEIQKGQFRYVRTNPSYRDFLRRYFRDQVKELSHRFMDIPTGIGANVFHYINQCCETGGRIFSDELMSDGSTIHSFVRRIAYNATADKTAVAIAVLSITAPDEGTTYANIARALAADYYNIYYVDLETENFIEYTSSVGGEELAMERHGQNFFEVARRDTMKRIYEEDRELFLLSFSKEKVIRQLNEQGVFTATYRLIDTGAPVYVNMKIMRMLPDAKHIIIGISVVDSQMKQQELNEAIQREETASSRIMALAGDYLTLYTVDPKTDHYFEYSSVNAFQKLGLARTGENFFEQGVIVGKELIHPDDRKMFLESFTKEKVSREIQENEQFKLKYRLYINGRPCPVLLKIVSVKESEGEKYIAGVRLWKDRR